MASRNDITGDAIQTRVITDTYRNNYDLIFGKKKKDETTTTANDPVQEPTTPADTEQND